MSPLRQVVLGEPAFMTPYLLHSPPGFGRSGTSKRESDRAGLLSHLDDFDEDYDNDEGVINQASARMVNEDVEAPHPRGGGRADSIHGDATFSNSASGGGRVPGEGGRLLAGRVGSAIGRHSGSPAEASSSRGGVSTRGGVFVLSDEDPAAAVAVAESGGYSHGIVFTPLAVSRPFLPSSGGYTPEPALAESLQSTSSSTPFDPAPAAASRSQQASFSSGGGGSRLVPNGPHSVQSAGPQGMSPPSLMHEQLDSLDDLLVSPLRPSMDFSPSAGSASLLGQQQQTLPRSSMPSPEETEGWGDFGSGRWQ